jgi:hypothetical protein
MSSPSPAPNSANHPSLLTLSFHDTLSAWPAGGSPTVRVIRGVAWATQEGDRRDHVLRGGQEVVLARHGRVVIQSIHRDGTEIQLDDLQSA